MAYRYDQKGQWHTESDGRVLTSCADDCDDSGYSMVMVMMMMMI